MVDPIVSFYRLGLVGYPLGHSLSPALHRAALRASRLVGAYDLYTVPPEDTLALEALVARLKAGEIHGLNVTIPHKQKLALLVDGLSPAARAIGAVNTLTCRAGQAIGNGDLLVIDYNGTSVKRFDSNGSYINNFITGLSQAEGVDFFPNGNILIGNGATHSVKMYDSNGVYIEDFIPNGLGGLITPNAIVIRELNPSSVSGDGDVGEKNFILEQNFPNPFNPSTVISYRFPVTREVTLKVYNILGNEVATLVNEEKDRGVYTINFDASGLASGMYLYRLQAGSFVETKKMILMNGPYLYQHPISSLLTITIIGIFQFIQVDHNNIDWEQSTVLNALQLRLKKMTVIQTRQRVVGNHISQLILDFFAFRNFL